MLYVSIVVHMRRPAVHRLCSLLYCTVSTPSPGVLTILVTKCILYDGLFYCSRKLITIILLNHPAYFMAVTHINASCKLSWFLYVLNGTKTVLKNATPLHSKCCAVLVWLPVKTCPKKHFAKSNLPTFL